jgi:large subunit ribosomal protein L4
MIVEKNIKKDSISSKESLFTTFDFKDLKLEITNNPSMALALSVKVHRQNSRQGTVACKDRSMLTSRSNKKPWRQKGTGKARAGTPRSPIWRGGAVSHGPQKRIRRLYIPKKIVDSAFRYVISEKKNSNQVFMLSWIPNGSCKSANSILKNGKKGDKIILLYKIDDQDTYNSFANISSVSLVSYCASNPFFFARNGSIVFLEKDKDLFYSMVKSWEN